ncbi:MAG: polysaccharide deacetylase family protein [Acidimicrobiales bacterium]
MSGVVFTLDLEDHRPDETAELRFPTVTDRLLDDLEEWGVIGTVFVVGDVVRDEPDLVARVAARGHEIGLHGATHTPLPDVGAERFRVVTAEALERLTQTIQAPVSGFRAPIFSLVPESSWAPEILADLGFTYSSSVLPARNPLYGWPGAPREPFRWPGGLIEIPSPIFGIGPATVPLLGGVYLRVAPEPLVRWAARRAPDHAWLYSHPYDFDPDEQRWLLPEVGRLGSRVMWWGRKGMAGRVQRIVAGTDRRLIDVVDALGEVPTFDPESVS